MKVVALCPELTPTIVARSAQVEHANSIAAGVDTIAAEPQAAEIIMVPAEAQDAVPTPSGQQEEVTAAQKEDP